MDKARERPRTTGYVKTGLDEMLIATLHRNASAQNRTNNIYDGVLDKNGRGEICG
jgi:hypothetical protein